MHLILNSQKSLLVLFLGELPTIQIQMMLENAFCLNREIGLKKNYSTSGLFKTAFFVSATWNSFISLVNKLTPQFAQEIIRYIMFCIDRSSSRLRLIK